MSGDRFNFDETGDTFCCFLVATFTVILLPLTYIFWPASEVKETIESIKRRCQCEHCQIKRASFRSEITRRWLKRALIKTIFLVAWAVLFLLILKLSKFEVAKQAFDPFYELSIDRDASKTDIKKAYKKLSLVHHPDRGGDEQKFIRIRKAYMALTDEVAKKNWQDYGNPDGPEAINFGIALPKWMITKENTVFVVAAYAIVFLLILPSVVGIWWYNTMKYSSSQVLLVTIRLFCGSFMYNPFMAMPRVIKLLSTAYEYNSQFNKDIACRPSDNVELPPLISQIPMFTIFKRAIVGAPYSIKARALIYAHMLRLDLPPKSLFVDKQYIVAQAPRLLEEMINSLLFVLSMANEEHCVRKNVPHLMATMENCMHLAPMVVQAISPSTLINPLLQLPHIGPNQIRQISHGQRNLKTIRQLARLSDDKRRPLLSSLTEEQYRDVVNVMAIMPVVEISCKTEVIDDEDQSIWPSTMVTVLVKLTRYPMLSSSISSSTFPTSQDGHHPLVVDASTDLRCTDKDASWYLSGGGDPTNPRARGGGVGRFNDFEGFRTSDPPHCEDADEGMMPADGDQQQQVSQRHPSSKSNAWDKSGGKRGGRGGKGGKGNRGKRFQHPRQSQASTATAASAASTTTDAKDPAAILAEDLDEEFAGVGAAGREGMAGVVVDAPLETSSKSVPNGQLTTGDGSNGDNETTDQHLHDGTGETVAKTDNNDTLDQQVESAARQRELKRSLQTKTRCSHAVHCPLFPKEKCEGWWVYLVDRKLRQLVTKPVFINFLETEEEMDLKFVAPNLPGNYLYTLCVRSDSYVDSDFFENLPFTVIPLPSHVIQTLRDAEQRALEGSSSSENEDDDDDEEKESYSSGEEENRGNNSEEEDEFVE